MKPALIVGLVSAVALAAWPPGPLQQDAHLAADVDAGYCQREVVTYTAFLPVVVQQFLVDAGYPLTATAQPYKRLEGRAWQCNWPDGGALFIPPRLSGFAEYFRPDLTSVVTPCVAGDAGTLCPTTDTGADDGGADALQEVAFECACSTGTSCTLTADGGVAPQGVTLPAGSWTGAGCRQKSCGVLFRPFTRADGGVSLDESWPAVCPGGG